MLAGPEAQLHRRPVVTMTTPEDFWRWQSWVDSANDPAVGFPLQSLPYCAFAPANDPSGDAHLGVAIGSFILDLHELSRAVQLDGLAPQSQKACLAPTLNALMRCASNASSSLRQNLVALLRDDASSEKRRTIESLLTPPENLRFLKPVAVGNYTDFYASIHHATNVGKLFRPDQPLLPNYKWIPIGYHGRASSLVISGTYICRPSGPTKLPEASEPTFAPTSPARLRTRSRRLHRRRQSTRRTHFYRVRQSSTFSAYHCSMTGPPATSSHGNTNPSVHFSARVSPPASLRSLCRWKRCFPTGPQPNPAHPATPNRSPTLLGLFWALSISVSKFSFPQPKCAKPRWLLFASAQAISAISIGHSPR